MTIQLIVDGWLQKIVVHALCVPNDAMAGDKKLSVTVRMGLMMDDGFPAILFLKKISEEK